MTRRDGIELRRPDPDGDFDEALALVQETDRAVYGASDWTAAELHEEWDGIDLQQDAWVAGLDGRIAGLMHIYDHTDGVVEADGYVHPALTGRGVGSLLLDAVEARALDFGPEVPAGGRLLVRISHLVGDAGAPAFFEGRGFRRARTFLRLVIDLDPLPAAPEWPPGIEVTSFDPGTQGRALHAAYEQAFVEEWGHRARPYEAWAEKMLVSAAPSLEATALAWDGGEIVGFALNREKHMGDWGFVRSLGVLPAWRGRGLGLALLQESFRRFAGIGETTAALGVDSENPTGATRLYERAGMRLLWRADVWEKELRAGA